MQARWPRIEPKSPIPAPRRSRYARRSPGLQVADRGTIGEWIVTKWLWIAGGGALGAVARYAIVEFTQRAIALGLPVGTLMVNVLGSLVLGALTEFSRRAEWLPESVQMAVIVGFLGSLTTWSTFAHETVRLAEGGDWPRAAQNVGLQLALGIGAVVLGIALIRLCVNPR